jgi:hypothetical protein
MKALKRQGEWLRGERHYSKLGKKRIGWGVGGITGLRGRPSRQEHWHDVGATGSWVRPEQEEERLGVRESGRGSSIDPLK